MREKLPDRPSFYSLPPPKGTKHDGRDDLGVIEQMRAETENLIAAQTIIAASRDQYALLFEQSPVAQIVLDEQGMIVDVNHAAAFLLPHRPSVDRQTSLRGLISAEDRALLDTHLSTCRADGSASSGEIRFASAPRSGSSCVALKTRFVIDPGIYVVAVLDRAEHKQLQLEKRQIEEAERAAQDAAKAKDTFIAALSHELRAPLTPILAAITALEEGRLSLEGTFGLYELIHRNVLLQRHLIDDLLDITRIVSGKIRLDREPLDLHLLVRDVAEGLRENLSGEGLTLSIHLDAALSQVDGDAVRLKQMVGNLLRNALKFTPRGGQIMLRSWNRGATLVLEIADSGLGIDADSLERIFVPFEQAVDPARHGGLGLGLAICRGIMSLHGGEITAQSRGVGKGSRFLLELATRPATRGSLESEIPRRRATPALRNDTRLLLVEDQPDVARVFKVILTASGYEVHVATCAKQALGESLDDIDLIVSDIGLPDLDGRELLRRLHARRRVPAIALSGYGTEQDIRDSLDAGFVAHVTKPTETATLLAAIASAIGRA